jgi:hypothetical protein
MSSFRVSCFKPVSLADLGVNASLLSEYRWILRIPSIPLEAQTWLPVEFRE